MENKSKKKSKFKVLGLIFSKHEGNVYLKFEKPSVLGAN
jgi:hypothetical protein